MKAEVRAETALALLSIALAAFFLAEGSTLKPGVFEPIGPGAVPMGVAVVTIVLGALVLLARARARRPAVAEVGAAAEDWPLTLGVGAVTLAYCLALHLGVLRYGIATTVYVVVAIVLLAPQRRSALPWAAGIGAVTGFGLDLIFRHLLVADLP